MADNVVVTPGVGATIAADEVTDGTLGSVKVQYIKVMDGAIDSTNKMSVSSGGAVKVDGSAVTQPVSGTVTATGTVAATQSGTWTVQPGNTANTTAWKVDGSAVTQPVSAASLPLPSGASTAAKQPALGTAGTASADVISVQGVASMTALKVDGSAVTQPISAASLPLPALAATSTKQSDGSQKTQVVDGSGNVIGATSNALDVNIKSGNPTTIAATQSGTWTVQPGNTANTTAWKVDGSAVTQPVSAASLPLPSGASTAAKQPALGTAGSASADVLSIQGIASMTKLLVTPDANSAVNVAQINGVAPTMGNGASGTGVQRVTIASDSTGILATVTNVATIGTSVTPGTSAAHLGKAEDAAHTSGDTGVFMLAVANEAQTALAADGDYIAHATDTKGNSLVVGNVASDGVDAGYPVKIGGQARTTNPTAVADADRVNAIFDKLGKQICVGAIRTLKGVTQTQISNSTSETTIVAAVASTFQDLYGLVFANTGATTTKVTVKDSTAGTTRMIFEVPTLETRGFMVPVDSAIPQATVNTNWTATCASATTAMEVTALWVSNI